MQHSLDANTCFAAPFFVHVINSFFSSKLLQSVVSFWFYLCCLSFNYILAFFPSVYHVGLLLETIFVLKRRAMLLGAGCGVLTRWPRCRLVVVAWAFWELLSHVEAMEFLLWSSPGGPWNSRSLVSALYSAHSLSFFLTHSMASSEKAGYSIFNWRSSLNQNKFMYFKFF